MHEAVGKYHSSIFKWCRSPNLETLAKCSHIIPIKETRTPESKHFITKALFLCFESRHLNQVKFYSATASRFNQNKK